MTQPSDKAPVWQVAMAAAGGAVGGFVLALLVAYVVVWWSAPYRQRNAERMRVDKARRVIRKLRDKRPKFILGEPFGLEKEWLQIPATANGSRYSVAEVQMFRIPVHNKGYICRDTTIRIIAVEPPFPEAPGVTPPLHLHPPLAPHTRYFTMSTGDDALVDFIGYSPEWAGGSWWLANTEASDGFIYYEDELHADVTRRVTVEVIGGGRSKRRDYAVWINQGFLDVTTWEDHLEAVERWNRDLADSGLSQDDYIAKLFAERDAADSTPSLQLDAGTEGPSR